jgi:hypothetical protein
VLRLPIPDAFRAELTFDFKPPVVWSEFKNSNSPFILAAPFLTKLATIAKQKITTTMSIVIIDIGPLH